MYDIYPVKLSFIHSQLFLNKIHPTSIITIILLCGRTFITNHCIACGLLRILQIYYIITAIRTTINRKFLGCKIQTGIRFIGLCLFKTPLTVVDLLAIVNQLCLKTDHWAMWDFLVLKTLRSPTHIHSVGVIDQEHIIIFFKHMKDNAEKIHIFFRVTDRYI